MKDKDGTIIYVGKAVNLKNRVRSYFRDTEHTPKVAAMISHIDDFDILLCDSNLEALCLECNLIKLHKPYYNIRLKDDKHYPYLRVNLKEPFPRLTLARREWARMKSVDSRECRNCHSFESMNPEAQKQRARKQHEMAIEDNMTCIDCHKGIAHHKPEGMTEEDEE